MAALQIPTYTDARTMIVLANAYVRVNGVSIDNVARSITISAALYPNKAAFDAGATPVVIASFEAPPQSYASNADPLITSALGYLKTLPPFQGASDVA